MNFGKVISKISPKKKELKTLQTVTEEILSKIKKLFGKEDVKVVLGGSVAKETYLETKDIDIFVKFKEGTEDISKKLISKLQKEFKVQTMHGSRDYANFVYKKHDIEVIPVLDVNPEKAKNTMDISPHHVDYVKKNLVNNDGVKLLKKFCKNNGLYGAESYISGFSGYLLELLIIKYKTFANLVMNVSDWKTPVVIDLKNYYSSNREAVGVFESTIFIVVDPVFKKRNVAAAVNEESLAKFVFLCRQFVREPSENFFLKSSEVSIEKMKKISKKRGTKFYVFKTKIREDYFERDLAKLKRKVKKIKKELEKNDFYVYSHGFKEDGTIYFEIYNPHLPHTKKIEGPPVWIDKENFYSFVNKHKTVYVEGDRLKADTKRKHTDVKKLLDELI